MRSRTILWLAMLAAATWLGGCGQPPLRISGPDAVLPQDDGSPGFLDRISSAPDVSENDAMRAVLMLLDGEDAAENFQQRVRTLADRKIVDRTWRHDADRPVTKGKLAYMIYQACGVPGGVTLQLTGPSQRYCLRELQYRGMIGAGAVTSRVSGMELVASMGRADEYRQTGEVPDVLKAGGD